MTRPCCGTHLRPLRDSVAHSLVDAHVQALGAQVVCLVVVLALVEQAADHVHPVQAAVALHPALLDLLLVLALDLRGNETKHVRNISLNPAT